ncbi:MAG: hypothetical protein M0027_19330 [Candidatus Dormibacteraeota bacterium]|nr:hypothetical protein [Candidatus Dormibacteraeota bacterium]
MDPKRKAALTAGTVGIAILAAGDAANFLSGACPSYMTIASPFFQEHREGNLKRLRQGEVIGGGLALLVGVGASLAADSALPFWVTAAVTAVLLAGYEWSASHPS